MVGPDGYGRKELEMVELDDKVIAYATAIALAKDVCFAMARAPMIADVAVTDIPGYGWCIEARCDSRVKAINRLWALLGKRKAAKVNWT